MLTSASCRGPAARNFYVCSSCLLFLNSRNPSERLPINTTHHPNRAVQFSTTRTARHDSPEVDNVPEASENVLDRGKGQYKDPERPLSRSKATLMALRRSLLAEIRTPNTTVEKANEVEESSSTKADRVEDTGKKPSKGGKKVTPATPQAELRRRIKGKRNYTPKTATKALQKLEGNDSTKTRNTTASPILSLEADEQNIEGRPIEHSKGRTNTNSTLPQGPVKIRKQVSSLKVRRVAEPLDHPIKKVAQLPHSELSKLVRDGRLSESAKAAVLNALRATPYRRPPQFSTLKQALQRSGRVQPRRVINKTEAKKHTKPEDNLDILPKRMQGHDIETVNAASLNLRPVDKGQLDVPGLSYGLERVLFNPGVYQLQDPRSRVFNFDPYLQTIMPVSEFDFSALKAYITSSRDKALLGRAKQEGKKYTGSTSSMSSSLAHFHFLLSQWRPVTTGGLSKVFPVPFHTFTMLQRAPVAIFLRWKDGVYAIDADKQFDSGNILMSLGKSMEKLLTMSTEDFEKYRKENSHQVTEAERNDPEPFHYSTLGDFLLRSQLDAHDPRLPGTGMFDLKTRAVVSIRMDISEYEVGRGYEIRSRHGEWASYEREYYDMIRSAFLKYSMQVRMGRMDGIFVAFHNTERIFGFQYISLSEMDYCIHGTENLTLGDSEFKLSLDLLNKVLDRATAKFPEKTLRLHFETREGVTPFMYIFAEPIDEEVVEQIQATNREAIEKFEREVLGLGVDEDGWASMQDNVETTMINDEVAPEELSQDSEEPSTAWDDSQNTEEESDERDHEDYELEVGSSQEYGLDSKSVNECIEEKGEEKVVGEDIDPEVLENEGDEVEETEDVEEDVLKEEQRGPEEGNASSAPTETKSSSLAEDETSEPKEAKILDATAEPTDDGQTKTKPVLAMTLTIRNRVNGQYVERPNKLTKDDDWVVEYSLAEISDQKRARNLLKLTKARRSQVFNKKFDLTSDSRNDTFIKGIQKCVAEGRKYREEINEVEKNMPKKVLESKV